MSSNPQSEGTWSTARKWLGALGSAVVVLSAAVVLYDWYFKGPDVEVRVLAADFHIPPVSVLDQQEQEEKGRSSQQPKHSADDQDEARWDRARKTWLALAAERYSRFRGFYELKISNDGGTAAEDIAIHMGGSYADPELVEITGTAIPTQVLTFSDPIRVGQLSPRESATVRVWGTYPPVGVDINTFRVTHRAGTGHVVILHETDGWWRTFFRTLWRLITLVGMGIVVVFVAFALIGVLADYVVKRFDKAPQNPASQRNEGAKDKP